MKGESEVPGGALNLISTNYPDHGHHGRLPLSGKTHMVQPGIEPGSSDHQATRQVAKKKVSAKFVPT